MGKYICTQCGRHCSINYLQCGKGRKYFQSIQETNRDSEIAVEQDDLGAVFTRCTHFLYYQKGKKKGQGKVLKIIAENPGISQKEVQDLMEIQAGSISEIMMKLEHKGLIARTKDEEDKRKTRLDLTEAGQARVAEIKEKHKKGHDLFHALNEEEQETLKGLLDKLLVSWEEEHSRGKGKGCGHHGHHEHSHGGCGDGCSCK